MNTNLLRCFSIDEDRATANGKYPGEYLYGTYTYMWNAEANRYADEYKDIKITVYFHALSREKIDISLPLNALRKDQMEDLNKRADDGEIIHLQLDGLTIGLRQNFRNKEIALTAKADKVSIIASGDSDDLF